MAAGIRVRQGGGVSHRDLPLTRATAEDWRAVRDIRLRALADSPDSFGALLADARELPESVWRERLSAPSPTYVAWDGTDPVAMGGGFLVPDSHAAMVWGMWTAPTHRGRGLGGRVLTTVVDWAHGAGRTAYLHVTEGNDAARALYVGAGFEPTGEWSPLREGSSLRVETLVLRRG